MVNCDIALFEKIEQCFLQHERGVATLYVGSIPAHATTTKRSCTLTLHQQSGDVVGKVKVKLKFDISEEMMQMLINDISKACSHWSERIVIHETIGKDNI